MTDLSHVMMIEYEEACGPVNMGPHVALFNINNITQKEVIKLIQSGGYSPSVVIMTKAQYETTFLNKK